MKIKECDVLVIGGGGSGALASLEASGHEHLKIILACKGPVGQSGLTPTANGGTRGRGSPEFLFEDMVTAGCFLNDQELVWFMVNQIPTCLERLKQMGIAFVPLGERSVCVPSTEALKRLRALILTRPNIELIEDILITRLLKSDGKLTGAMALDLATGEFLVIKAAAVVVATGGSTGELYPHTSNNPFGVTTGSSGTGHAMAYLAGADLIDMEMIQFVPLPSNPRCLYLRYFPDFWAGPYQNRLGDVIESNPNTYQGESYSYRFIRKLFEEVEKGNGPISIDQRQLADSPPGGAIKSWDQRRRLMKAMGIDPHENKIDITIGSHFSMGGIRVNTKTETTVPGLFAAGEVMGGVHGGMRLSGYSFTQMIVFGLEAGRRAARHALEQGMTGEISFAEVEAERERLLHFLKPKQASLTVSDLKRRLQTLMEKHVFVTRDRAGLTETLRQIAAFREDLPRIAVPDFKRFNLEWANAIELPLTVEVAEIVVQSALAREESRGFHCRRDFPEEDNRNWLKHTVARREEGRLKISPVPVTVDRMRPA